MLAPNTKTVAEERRAERHRQNVAESAPFLDKSIPLGFPAVEDAQVIERFYARKHSRGAFGTYWPLHQVKKGFGTMRDMRPMQRK